MSNNVLINMRYGPSVRPNDRISAELSFFFLIAYYESRMSFLFPEPGKPTSSVAP